MQKYHSLLFSGKNITPYQVTDLTDVSAFNMAPRFGKTKHIVKPLNNGLLIRESYYECPIEVNLTSHADAGLHIYMIDHENAIDCVLDNKKNQFHHYALNMILERDDSHYCFHQLISNTLVISLTPEMLDRAQQMTGVVLDKQLKLFLAGQSFKPRFSYLPMPIEIKQIMAQIRNPPYEDEGLKQLYIETKTQEWLIHILYCLSQSKTDKNKTQTITQQQKNYAIDTKDYLLANLRYPPSLAVLAHQVGTNEKKLNESFKQVFGSTVFVWLREQRLLKAMELLETGQKSIQQIAYYCGYKHSSDFSNAFKKHFKVTPTVIKNQVF